MTKNELKAKYGRIANDPSQLEMFKDDVVDGVITGLPELPEETEGKTLILQMQDGELSWTEGGGSGPSEPVKKGDICFFGEHRYRVLEANEDNTNVKVMLLDDCISSKFNESDTKVDFDVSGTTVQGQKYEDSALETACLSFVESLPQEVQDAIIAEEIEQDMWDTNSSAEDALTFVGFDMTYRLKKLASIAVGSRLAHSISMSEIIAYLGESLTCAALNKMMFDYNGKISIYLWTMSARSSLSSFACDVRGTYGFFLDSYFSYPYFVRPAFRLNLKSVSYIK